MKLNIYHFTIPFSRPLITSKGVFDHREGLVIEVSHHGSSYWAEVSPLPGFSDSSTSGCLEWLKTHENQIELHLQQAFESAKRNSTLIEAINQVADSPDNFTLTEIPSEIEFALDYLSLQFISGISEFTNLSVIPININGTANTLEGAVSLVQNGFSTIKIKVGINWENEFQLISEFRRLFPNVTIRLDANEAWSVNEAKVFLRELIPFNIDYIEQPVNVRNLVTYGAVLSKFGVDIAADESARSVEMIRELIHNHAVSVFMIKPPMIGGFNTILKCCEMIHKSCGRIVCTSSLDTSLNYSISAFLASIWSAKNEYHGFSTGSMLSSDLSTSPPVISDSRLLIDPRILINPGSTLNKSLLTRLD